MRVVVTNINRSYNTLKSDANIVEIAGGNRYDIDFIIFSSGVEMKSELSIHRYDELSFSKAEQIISGI